MGVLGDLFDRMAQPPTEPFAVGGTVRAEKAIQALEDMLRRGRRAPGSSMVAHQLVASLLSGDRRVRDETLTHAKLMRMLAQSGRTPRYAKSAGRSWQAAAEKVLGLDFALDEKKSALRMIAKLLRRGR
jgi:hypothetical protein